MASSSASRTGDPDLIVFDRRPPSSRLLSDSGPPPSIYRPTIHPDTDPRLPLLKTHMPCTPSRTSSAHHPAGMFILSAVALHFDLLPPLSPISLIHISSSHATIDLEPTICNQSIRSPIITHSLITHGHASLSFSLSQYECSTCIHSPTTYIVSPHRSRIGISDLMSYHSGLSGASFSFINHHRPDVAIGTHRFVKDRGSCNCAWFWLMTDFSQCSFHIQRFR